MNQQLELLDQIIEMAAKKAAQLNAYKLANHQALETIGEDTVVFHLKALRELMTDTKVYTSKVSLDNREFTVALGGNKTSEILPDVEHPFPTYHPFIAP